MEQPILGRTGGVYIPPFKLAQIQKKVDNTNQYTEEQQRISWEALRKSINGLINKVNVSNIKNIIPELFSENLIRARGILARAIMKAQLASPGFTHIYSALVAVLNTKLPENGELILKRVIRGFKRAYKRRDKIVASALAKFIAHLVNHQIAHELLALQLLTILLEEPTDDSVEIAVNFVKEVGQLLSELSPQGLHAIFERFRALLHEGDIDKRVQYTIEGLFAIRKSGFADYPSIPKELDLVEREDQITFEMGLDEEDVDTQEMLDIFRYDAHYQENEELWEKIKTEILGGDEEEDEEEGEGDEEGNNEVIEEDTMNATTKGGIVDLTEQELINLRRTLYLTIMSSASFEECTHKIIKLKIPDGCESELCNMLIECCSNERSYQRYYGLMGQRFCMIHRKYQAAFDEAFFQQYNGIHRLETNKLRNVAKFFAHLLATDALPWTCLECIQLNESDTTSSSRIFIKILTQELSEALGLVTLKERFNDPYMQTIFSGLFPRQNTRDTRFAINFFTSIGLGSLTDELREYLKNAPKLLAKQMEEQMKKEIAEKMNLKSGREEGSDNDSSSSSNSDDSSSDSNSCSGSDSDSSSGSDSSGSSSSSDSDSSSGSSSSDSSSGSSSSDSESESDDDDASRKRKSNSNNNRSADKQPIAVPRKSSSTSTTSITATDRHRTYENNKTNDDDVKVKAEVATTTTSNDRRRRYDIDTTADDSNRGRSGRRDDSRDRYHDNRSNNQDGEKRQQRNSNNDAEPRRRQRSDSREPQQPSSLDTDYSKRNATSTTTITTAGRKIQEDSRDGKTIDRDERRNRGDSRNRNNHRNSDSRDRRDNFNTDSRVPANSRRNDDRRRYNDDGNSDDENDDKNDNRRNSGDSHRNDNNYDRDNKNDRRESSSNHHRRNSSSSADKDNKSSSNNEDNDRVESSSSYSKRSRTN